MAPGASSSRSGTDLVVAAVDFLRVLLAGVDDGKRVRAMRFWSSFSVSRVTKRRCGVLALPMSTAIVCLRGELLAPRDM
ncbi:hypothetical protein HYQ46_004373 [Verticillium longisporum]|nr:hypothetical protein HYQ46_004373 [Verticillium longisporum]